MTKKLFFFLLTAPLMLGLSMGVASCSDDDDDEKTPEQQQQEQAQQADKFWSVVGQLVSSNNYTADYQGKTFEPTYGMAEQEGSYVRIMETNDLQTAVQRFNNLIEGNITEETQSYTWSDPDVGTLSYTKTNDGKSFAEVDVDIKQVPHLTKIIYREGGQGENGSFQGKAYYRFGDVLKRTYTDTDNKKIEEYWICVRPAFGPEKKEDSHWVCVNTLPAKNRYVVPIEGGKDYVVPTGVGKDKENMQNFAELLYAIEYPKQWYENASNFHTDGKLWGFSGMPIFADFSKKNLEYHNQFFWEKVAEAWEKYDFWRLAMNTFEGNVYDAIGKNNTGLNLLYYGYSWWNKLSWNCTLYQASYTNGTSDKEKNLHHAVYTEIEKNMEPIDFDCTTMGRYTSNYIKFFDDDKKERWVIRHATGKELNGGIQPAATAPIQNPQVTEAYRYYTEFPKEWQRPDPQGGIGPEVTPDLSKDPNYVSNAPTTGAGTYMLGDVLVDGDGNRWICWLGSPSMDKTVTDHRAFFISFEFNGVDTDGAYIKELPEEKELAKTAFYVAEGFSYLQMLTGDYQFKSGINAPIGKVAEHIQLYAGINLRDLLAERDSTWRFWDYTTQQYYDSYSMPWAFCLAYNDGVHATQPIARVIYDPTQAGSKRNNCYALNANGEKVKHQDMFFRLYTNYQEFKHEDMTLDAESKSLQMEKWNLPWPTTGQQMTLADLSQQPMVEKYAYDKWVVLPLTGTTGRGKMRTQAEPKMEPSDYLLPNCNYVPHKGMYNEPVLFLRTMWIEDDGGKVPNLVSTDGRRLSVVHMQNDAFLYGGNSQAMWVLYSTAMRRTFTTNNELTPIPEIDGISD